MIRTRRAALAQSVERFSEKIMRQKNMAPDYAFRPMSSVDLALIRRWLQMPEVRRWWGDPDEQYELVSSDLAHPDMDQFIVSCDGQPFAYIQCYALSTWNQGFGAHPAQTRGIDQFIGEP